MNEKQVDRFSQLEQDLVDDKLSIKQVGIAIRSAIRRTKHLPKSITDLLGGKSDISPGVLSIVFRLIEQIIGNMDLAYKRGVHTGIHEAYLILKSERREEAAEYLLEHTGMNEDGSYGGKSE